MYDNLAFSQLEIPLTERFECSPLFQRTQSTQLYELNSQERHRQHRDRQSHNPSEDLSSVVEVFGEGGTCAATIAVIRDQDPFCILKQTYVDCPTIRLNRFCQITKVRWNYV